MAERNRGRCCLPVPPITGAEAAVLPVPSGAGVALRAIESTNGLRELGGLAEKRDHGRLLSSSDLVVDWSNRIARPRLRPTRSGLKVTGSSLIDAADDFSDVANVSPATKISPDCATTNSSLETTAPTAKTELACHHKALMLPASAKVDDPIEECTVRARARSRHP